MTVDPDDPRAPIKQRLGIQEKSWEGEKCQMNHCLNDNEDEAVNTIKGTPACQTCWDGYMDHLSMDYY